MLVQKMNETIVQPRKGKRKLVPKDIQPRGRPSKQKKVPGCMKMICLRVVTVRMTARMRMFHLYLLPYLFQGSKTYHVENNNSSSREMHLMTIREMANVCNDKHLNNRNHKNEQHQGRNSNNKLGKHRGACNLENNFHEESNNSSREMRHMSNKELGQFNNVKYLNQ